jgi:putative membrane protein insertion efficiency factor
MEEAKGQPRRIDGRRVSLPARPLIGLVRVYQAVGRPLFGGHCRFRPTCSDYAIGALRRHGALRGSYLAIRRLLRCHPLGGAGYDPVPPTRH